MVISIPDHKYHIYILMGFALSMTDFIGILMHGMLSFLGNSY